MRRLAIASAFLLFTALSAAGSSAAAQSDDDARARTHFESGRLHFDEGDYEQALSEFTSAYELSHRDGLLYNLYLANERLGHLAEAADRLEAYLATDVVPADERPTLERRLVHLRERVAAGATTVDDTPPPPTPASNDHPLLVPGIVTLAAGGVGLILFGALGGAAMAEDSRLASTCGADAGRTCTDDDLGTLRGLSLGADISLTVGLVAAAVGAVLLVVDATSGSSETPRAMLLPMIGDGTAGLAAVGSF